MERLHYLDFELQIEQTGDHYTARVLRSPVGEASGTFTLPFSEDRLENLVLKLGRLRRNTRRAYSNEMEAAREFGGELFNVMFTDEILACLRSSLSEVHRREETGLRLKLRLQEVAELANLPWEFLFDPSLERFLAQSSQTPIVRYMDILQRIQPLTIHPPLRILAMISSPSDYVNLDVEREKGLLQDALEPLRNDGKVQVEWLEDATLRALQRHLRRGQYHVFHFIGHGGFDPKTEEGVLVLEDEQGRGWLAGAHRIATILHDHRSLRLAVLNACEGARNSRTDPFAGVATSLIRSGIPAVVAMQFEITDDAAITFAEEFYTVLAEGFPVDAAVAEARKMIYTQPNDVEWGTPVLYMRSPDGVLFDFTQTQQTFAPEPELVETSQLQQPEQIPQPEPKLQSVASTTEETPQEGQEKEVQLPEPEPAQTAPEFEHTLRPAQKAIMPIRVEIVEVKVLRGHKKAVNTVAFSPDGKTLASGSGGFFFSGDCSVRLWRVSDGKLLRTLEGHTKAVNSVAFSPDGTLLASATYDRMIRLWRVSDGRRLRTLEAEIEYVWCVAFSPDGETLAGGIGHSDSGMVQMWQVSDGNPLRTLGTDAYMVKSMAFSPDGNTLVGGRNLEGERVQMWRVADGKTLHTFKGAESTEEPSVAFSPDGEIVASSGENGHTHIRLWRVSDKKLLHKLAVEDVDTVNSVAFSPDGAIVAGAVGKMVYMWRVADGRLLQVLKEHKKEVQSIDFSPDGETLASGSNDQMVRLCKLKIIRGEENE